MERVQADPFGQDLILCEPDPNPNLTKQSPYARLVFFFVAAGYLVGDRAVLAARRYLRRIPRDVVELDDHRQSVAMTEEASAWELRERDLEKRRGTRQGSSCA